MCSLVFRFQVHFYNIPIRQTTFSGVRSGSPHFTTNSKFGRIHLSIEASVAHHNCKHPTIAEIENVKNDKPSDLQFHLRQQMLLLKWHCTFYICEALGKKVFCWILKRWFISWIIGQNFQTLLISAFLPHNQQVSLC